MTATARTRSRRDSSGFQSRRRRWSSSAPPGTSSRRKLLPALYNLAHEGALPERFNLIGVSRRDLSDEEFRTQAREAIEEFSRRTPDPQVLEGLLGHMQYIGNPFDDTAGYAKIGAAMDALDAEAAGSRSTASTTSRPRPSSSR